MIQTQLLSLQPPYYFIYYGGIIGKQIATLVVTLDKTDEDGNYGIETHSHPVVVYNRQTAEGVVWDKCEVLDCRTVCSEIERKITLKQFNELMALTTGPKTDNPNNPMNLAEPMNPHYLRSALRAAGIGLEMPIEQNHYAPDNSGTPKHYKVKLFFDFCDDGMCVWSEFNEAPFYFNVEASDRKEVYNLLSSQLHEWKMALEEFRFSIEFVVARKGESYDEPIEFDEREAKTIVKKLNKLAK